MARKYDLHRLKHAVSITEVLVRYGLDSNLRQQREELVGPCPLPGHRGDRSNENALRVHPCCSRLRNPPPDRGVVPHRRLSVARGVRGLVPHA